MDGTDAVLFDASQYDTQYWSRIDMEDRIMTLEDLLTQAQRQLQRLEAAKIEKSDVTTLIREIGLVLG